MTWIIGLLRRLLVGLFALLLLFEEWGWAPLAAGMARLARLPLWAAIERRIARLPPAAALLVFFVPALSLLPVKLLALFLVGQGHSFLGIAVLIGAKIAGTALLARLFSITEPALMQLAWFARWYPRWKGWKDRVMDQVRRSPLWRAVRRARARARVGWQALRHPRTR